MQVLENMFSVVGSTSLVELVMVVDIKDVFVFTTSDIPGPRSLYAPSSCDLDEGTIRGTVIVNSSGQITGGSYTHSDGTVATFTGHTLTINGAGTVSGNATTNLAVTITVITGNMNASKNMFSFVDSTSVGALDMVVAINEG